MKGKRGVQGGGHTLGQLVMETLAVNGMSKDQLDG